MVVRALPRPFRVLVAGYAASTFGNFLNLIALNLYTYQVTGSAPLTGLMMAVKLGAGFLAGPVAGILATRWDRRRLMVGSDVAQALAMVALVATPAALHSVLLYPVAVVLGAGNTLFLVALRSSVPEMVGESARVPANSLLVTGKAVGMVAGFGSAGLLVESLGYATAFGLNAASFVVSALVLTWLPVRFRRLRDGGDTGPPDLGHPVAATRLLYAAAPLVLAMVALRGLDAFGSSSHNVGFPVYADLSYPDDPALFLSQFWLCWAVGSLAASQLVPRWLRRTGAAAEERIFPVAMAVMSVAFAAAFLPLPLAGLVAVAVTAGFADGATEIGYTSRLQATDDDLRGAVFGLSSTVETLGFAAGMAASSLLLVRLPVPVVVAVFHGLVVCGAVAFLVRLRARSPVPDSATRQGV